MKIRLLLFLIAFITASCNVEDNGDLKANSELVGQWKASQLITNPEEGVSANVQYEIEIKNTSNVDFWIFWNGVFAKGFSGTWVQKGDSLGLYAEKCFKGDSSGTKFENTCNEDFSSKYLQMEWNGKEIKFGSDSTKIVFQKK